MKTKTAPTRKATKRKALDPHQRVYFKTLQTYCLKFELKNNTENRYAVTQEALGYQKSSKEWTESEWDIVLSFMRHRINGNAGEWTPAHRVAVEIDGERKRKLWRIRKEIPDAYLREIAWDKYKVRDYSAMSIPDLEKLRLTAIERRRSADRQGRSLK
jgi:hypothetical protein